MWSKRQEDFVDQAKQLTAENSIDSGVFSYSFQSEGRVEATNVGGDFVDDEVWKALVDLASSYGFTLTEDRP